MKTEQMPTIPDVFSGQTIFITGGTGFLGKVLIEKLLRDCSNIKNVYVLIRSKKDKSPKERWSDITKQPLFDKLKEDQPSGLEKVVIFEGDIASKNLGLSPEDRKVIEDNVTLVFHAAASIRFDDSLQTALSLNTYGTLEVVELAKNIPLLQGLVYVSSTYANCHLENTLIEEKVYDSEFSYQDLLQLQLSEDENVHRVLEILRHKILNRHPNTYTFSKSLAEQIINDARKELPVIITRPSVVCNSLLGPVPGWIDNKNGLHMMTIGIIKGILRTVLANNNACLDYSPVDFAANGIIVAAWYNIVNNKLKKDEIPVYNIAYGNVVTTSYIDLLKRGHEVSMAKPLKNPFWYPFAVMTPNPFLYYIYFWILQIFPAVIADSILWIKGEKTIALSLMRKVYITNCGLLRRFVTESYNFDNSNYKILWSAVQGSDKEVFYLVPNFDVSDIFKIIHDGLRTYLLHEDESMVEENKATLKRLYWVHLMSVGVFISLVIYFLWAKGLPLLLSVFS